ncbi:hypothetical protein Tco_0548383 [Tanacetum coccineum]
MDEPHPAYDFFAPGPLPGYAGNPDNINGWLEEDGPPPVDVMEPAAKPMMVVELEQIADLMVEAVDEQMIAPMIDAEEDLAMLFGDEDFSDEDWGDDDDEEEDGEVVGEALEAWLMAPNTPPLMMSVPPPTTYEVRGPSTTTEGHSSALMTHGVAVPPSVIDELSTRMDNLEYGHGSLVKKVMTVSNAEVMACQMLQVVSGLEQGHQDGTHIDKKIAGLR